jgi:hypothetical protein
MKSYLITHLTGMNMRMFQNSGGAVDLARRSRSCCAIARDPSPIRPCMLALLRRRGHLWMPPVLEDQAV